MTDNKTLINVSALMHDVERINEDDPEAAHSYEDRARFLALDWIAANGDEQSQRLATEALRSQALSFPRWCA